MIIFSKCKNICVYLFWLNQTLDLSFQCAWYAQPYCLSNYIQLNLDSFRGMDNLENLHIKVCYIICLIYRDGHSFHQRAKYFKTNKIFRQRWCHSEKLKQDGQTNWFVQKNEKNIVIFETNKKNKNKRFKKTIVCSQNVNEEFKNCSFKQA